MIKLITFAKFGLLTLLFLTVQCLQIEINWADEEKNTPSSPSESSDRANDNGRRAIIIDIDGLRWDTFYGELKDGNLKNFERLFGGDPKCKAKAVYFDNSTTIFPTVTLPGHAAIYTGVYPGEHGIVGNQWFDRTGDVFRADFIPHKPFDYMQACSQLCIYAMQTKMISELKDSMLLACPEIRLHPKQLEDCLEIPNPGLMNKHLDVQTIYEAAAEANKSSLVIFSQYWRGVADGKAIQPTQPEFYMYGLSETRIMPDAQDFKDFDRDMFLQGFERVQKESFPDLLTLYFSGLDATGHMKGIGSQKEYISDFIDPNVGYLLDELEKQDKNWCRNTLVVLAADHGQMELDPGFKASAKSMGKALDRRGFKDAFVIAENGGMAHVYVMNRETSEWSAKPRFKEDVIPAAETLCGEVDEKKLWKILVRDDEGKYRVYNGSQDNSQTKKVEDGTEGAGSSTGVCETISVTELENDGELTSSPELNLPELINGLNSERSGDLLILLQPSYYFEHFNIARWAKKADHGGIHPGDLRVPVVLAGGGVEPDPEKCSAINLGNHCGDTVRTVNVARTVGEFLGFGDKQTHAKEALPVKFAD